MNCSQGHATLKGDRYCAECGEVLRRRFPTKFTALVVSLIAITGIVCTLVASRVTHDRTVAYYESTFTEEGCFYIECLFEEIEHVTEQVLD